MASFHWKVGKNASFARWDGPREFFNPEGIRMNSNIRWHDANNVFTLSLLAFLTLATGAYRVKCIENRCLTPQVFGIVHTESLVGLVHVDCIAISVVDRESERAILFRHKKNWRCPLNLRQLDIFQPKIPGDLVFLNLAHLQSILVWQGIDGSSIFWWNPDPLIDLVSLAQMAVPSKLQFWHSVYEFGAILCVTIQYFYIVWQNLFWFRFWRSPCVPAVVLHLKIIVRFVLHVIDRNLISLVYASQSPNHPWTFLSVSCQQSWGNLVRFYREPQVFGASNILFRYLGFVLTFQGLLMLPGAFDAYIMTVVLEREPDLQKVFLCSPWRMIPGGYPSFPL